MSKQSFFLKSMTAYGRAVTAFAHGTLTVEIQSVNRRHLELNLNLPRLLSRFDTALRKQIAAHLHRGMVTLSINWRSDAKGAVSVTPNLPLAKGIKAALLTIAGELDLDPNLDLALLAREKDLLLYEEELPDEAAFETTLTQSVDEALAQLLSMREAEGVALAQDIDGRLATLREVAAVVETQAPAVTERLRARLSDKLHALFDGKQPENEERLLREVALYAERSDITEELVRFKSHVDQMHELLCAPSGAKGKTLEFLIQELNRELNTIGSKASELAITQQVVKGKGELEKMREQVQNIE